MGGTCGGEALVGKMGGMGMALNKVEVEGAACEECKGGGWFGGARKWRSHLAGLKDYWGESLEDSVMDS